MFGSRPTGDSRRPASVTYWIGRTRLSGIPVESILSAAELHLVSRSVRYTSGLTCLQQPTSRPRLSVRFHFGFALYFIEVTSTATLVSFVVGALVPDPNGARRKRRHNPRGRKGTPPRVYEPSSLLAASMKFNRKI